MKVSIYGIRATTEAISVVHCLYAPLPRHSISCSNSKPGFPEILSHQPGPIPHNTGDKTYADNTPSATSEYSEWLNFETFVRYPSKYIRGTCLSSSHTKSYRDKADCCTVKWFPTEASTCSFPIKFECYFGTIFPEAQTLHAIKQNILTV